MASVFAEPPDVRLLFGPFLIGLLFNAILYGVVVVQFFIYYDRYKGFAKAVAGITFADELIRDRRWLRYLMMYLLLAETINTAFDTSLVYEPLVARWGQTEALQITPLFLRPDAAVTVAISTPVQLFMAWRLRALTKQSIFPAIISLLALVSLGGLTVTIKTSLKPDYSSMPGFHPFVTTWLVASAACDVVLSAALIYSLRVRKTGVGATDRYVDRIIRVTIQTGSITAITALLDVFVFLFAPPNTTLQFIWDFPLSKLYTNAVLSSVNSRPWKEDPTAHFTMNILFEPKLSEGQTSGLNEMFRATELHERTRRLPAAAFESALSEPTGESSQSPNCKDTESV